VLEPLRGKNLWKVIRSLRVLSSERVQALLVGPQLIPAKVNCYKRENVTPDFSSSLLTMSFLLLAYPTMMPSTVT
jgi:hypothetical protein